VLSHLEKVQELPAEVQAEIAGGVDNYIKFARTAKDIGFSHPPQTGAAGSARPTTPKRGDTKVVRLNAASKVALSNALRALQPGQKGWISFDDAGRLFSPSAEKPAEWDETRIRELAEFAAEIEHRSSLERNEGDNRVYFTRIRTLIL
jgi:hypothetical protein